MATDIVIDGSYGEGGGQIIRTSVALSAITGKSVQITNIRANRPNPGLQVQHLEAIKAVKELCNARTEGLEPGSKEVSFFPGKMTAREVNINIPTAGSIGLVLQALLPAALHFNEDLGIHIKGGATFGKWASPISYLQHVLLPLLEKIGYKISMEVKKHGFYPKGGAEVSVKVAKSQKQHQLALNKEVNFSKQLVNIYSNASKSLQKAKVAERQSEKAEEILKANGFSTKIFNNYSETDCPGSGILCFAKNDDTVIGSDALGEKDKPAEQVGKEAATKLIHEIKTKAPVDQHTADQLIPYLAMNKGSILISQMTEHTKTNIWVCEQFFGKNFKVEGNQISFD